MRIESLYYFIQVAQSGSFSRAADELYLSQPALSQSIKRLEVELGVELFTRQQKGINLTEAGKNVLREAKNIIATYNRLLNSIPHYKPTSQTNLRIGVSPLYQKFFLSRVQAEFVSRFPHCEVRVKEGFSDASIAGLLSENLDLAMINAPCPAQLVSCLTLFTEELYVAAPLKKQLPVTKKIGKDKFATLDIASLSNEEFVAYSVGRRLNNIMENICDQNGFKPHIVLRCDGAESVNSMVGDGVGIGIVPEVLVKNCAEDEHTAYFHIAGGNWRRTFLLVRNPKMPYSTIAHEFVNIAENYCSRHL